MGVTIAVSVITAVVAAAGTYLGTYLNNISLARRQDQLARVNAQLKDLYGPLAALLLSTQVLFDAWRRWELPLTEGWKGSSEEERQRWRGWMRTVLQPRNIAMAELVMSHSDLIDDMRMPPSLMALCAHVRYYEALQARWDEGDVERYIPYVLFPRDVTHDVVEAFNRLKARQADLLERRRLLRGRKVRTITRGDYAAELEEYIKRYERDAQLEEGAVGQPPAGSGQGTSRSASREAAPGLG
jgi:hypothetical protein